MNSSLAKGGSWLHVCSYDHEKYIVFLGISSFQYMYCSTSAKVGCIIMSEINQPYSLVGTGVGLYFLLSDGFSLRLEKAELND